MTRKYDTYANNLLLAINKIHDIICGKLCLMLQDIQNCKMAFTYSVKVYVAHWY